MQERAIENFKKSYNCAQAVACAYAEKMNMSEEAIFRLSEGFGGGLGHSGYTCGACSAMVLVASYLACPNMEQIGVSKLTTYPIIQDMVKTFIDENKYLNCFEIMEHGDTTLKEGKKTCCYNCVKSACKQLDNLFVAG